MASIQLGLIDYTTLFIYFAFVLGIGWALKLHENEHGLLSVRPFHSCLDYGPGISLGQFLGAQEVTGWARLSQAAIRYEEGSLGLDIRLPIGFMFALVGVLLALYGMTSDPSIYGRSLSININLWWGGVLLAFGLSMLFLANRANRSNSE